MPRQIALLNRLQSGLGKLGRGQFCGHREIKDVVFAIWFLPKSVLNINIIEHGSSAGAIAPDAGRGAVPFDALLGRILLRRQIPE
jgi:hypothetical protein